MTNILFILEKLIFVNHVTALIIFLKNNLKFLVHTILQLD
jgi:hypothetical protein